MTFHYLCIFLGFSLSLSKYKKVKLCFSFCRDLNKRCDIGTPGAELQVGDSSGDVEGEGVHVKVIFFFTLTGNGQNTGLCGNGRNNFFGE